MLKQYGDRSLLYFSRNPFFFFFFLLSSNHSFSSVLESKQIKVMLLCVVLCLLLKVSLINKNECAGSKKKRKKEKYDPIPPNRSKIDYFYLFIFIFFPPGFCRRKRMFLKFGTSPLLFSSSEFLIPKVVTVFTLSKFHLPDFPFVYLC